VTYWLGIGVRSSYFVSHKWILENEIIGCGVGECLTEIFFLKDLCITERFFKWGGMDECLWKKFSVKKKVAYEKVNYEFICKYCK